MLSGLLIYQGLQRKDPLVRAASEVGSDLSRAVDGQGHIPKHYYYLGCGGLLAMVGVGMLCRGRKA